MPQRTRQFVVKTSLLRVAAFSTYQLQNSLILLFLQQNVFQTLNGYSLIVILFGRSYFDRDQSKCEDRD